MLTVQNGHSEPVRPPMSRALHFDDGRCLSMNSPSINWSWLSRVLPVSLLLLNLQVGCSPHIAVKPPAPLSEEIRAQLGTIAIASKPSSTPFASPSPPSGWAQGFSQGVKTGAYYGAWPGLVILQYAEKAWLPPAQMTSMTTGLGLSTAGGALGGLIGGPVGAFQPHPNRAWSRPWPS